MVKNAKRELQKVSAREVEKAEAEHAVKMEAYFAEVGKVKESPEKAPVVHLFWDGVLDDADGQEILTIICLKLLKTLK